jgi:hypothetical protein
VSDEYEGRLATDGNGNLLAQDGDRAGEPVAYDEDNDNFVFIGWDEPSHNQRYHKQNAEIVITQDQDPDAPGYAGTADDPIHPAFFSVQEDDPHYDPEAENNTRLRNLPDSISPRVSSHTHQHKIKAGE